VNYLNTQKHTGYFCLLPNLRQVIYGILLVLMMMVRPQGLVGRYGFGR
jgi:ABC-type branched-subunit amino acid transport system permease subunit